MYRKPFGILVAGCLLLPALFILAYGEADFHSDLAPVSAPYRPSPTTPIFTDQITWVIGATMPTARYSGVTGTYGGEVFVGLGRYTASSPYNTNVVEAYDYAANTWRTNCTNAPTARRMIAGGAMYADEYMYAIGGRDTGSLTVGNNEIYNMSTDTWTTGAACTPRWAHAGAVLDGYVYVFGGTPATTTQRYNIATNTWETMAAMPNPAGWLGGYTAAGKIYAVGGSTTETVMREYDPATNTWSLKAPIPHGRLYARCVSHNNLVYSCGGDQGGNNIDVYDPATNTWVTETNMPSNISWHQMGVSDNAIYVIGGTPTSSPVVYQNQCWIAELIPAETGDLEGYVYENATPNDPLENVTVVCGSDSAYTDATGYYSIDDIAEGTYDVTATLFGYNPQTAEVIIVADSTTTQDFYMPQPIISVDVTSYELPITAGGSHEETFNISNLGDGVLDFEIEVEETGATVDVSRLSSNRPPARTALDNATQTSPYLADVSTGTAVDPILSNWGLDQVAWTQVGSAITPFIRAASGHVGNYVYCFGEQNSNVGQAYNITTQSWEASTPPLLGNCNWCGVTVDENIYIVGRYDGSYGNEVQKFTITGSGPTGTWEFVAPYPQSLCAVTADWDGGSYIYAAGGSSSDPAAYRYDIAANTWEAIAPMPSAMRYAGGAFCQGKFYVLGGTNTGMANTNYEYDPTTNTWATKAPIPTAIHFGLFSFTYNETYVLSIGGGGGYGSWPATNAVQLYDPATDTWMQETTLPQALGCNTGIWMGGGEVLSAGGYDGTNYHTETYLGTNFPGGEPQEPWIWVSPETGSVEPGESEMITVTFLMPDTANIGDVYTANIIIDNNTVTPTITIPVTVTIVEAVGKSSELLPMECALHQNYPNPFNPSTAIRYDIRETTHVTMAIYNVLGQKIATLIDGTVDAGQHTVSFDGSALASGVYFYRMDAGQFSDIKKMVVMK